MFCHLERPHVLYIIQGNKYSLFVVVKKPLDRGEALFDSFLEFDLRRTGANLFGDVYTSRKKPSFEKVLNLARRFEKQVICGG